MYYVYIIVPINTSPKVNDFNKGIEYGLVYQVE